MIRLSESNAYPKSVEEVKYHIRQTVQERKITKFDTGVIEKWQTKYPGLTKMEILTVFWLQRCTGFGPMQFHGKTHKDVKEYIKRCENYETVRNNQNIKWDTRIQIGYAIQAGMPPFNGTTQQEAEAYMEEYYQKLGNNELRVSREEIKHISAICENQEKNHLQSTVCQYCNNNITPCYQCPHYHTRMRQTK